MTRAEFKDALKRNVDISPDDFKLMLKIVDPKDHSLNDKKHKRHVTCGVCLTCQLLEDDFLLGMLHV